VKDSESEEDELLNLDDSDLELGEEKKEELPEKQIDPDQIQQPKPLKKKKKKCTLSNHDSKKEEKTLHSLHDPWPKTFHLWQLLLAVLFGRWNSVHGPTVAGKSGTVVHRQALWTRDDRPEEVDVLREDEDETEDRSEDP